MIRDKSKEDLSVKNALALSAGTLSFISCMSKVSWSTVDLVCYRFYPLHLTHHKLMILSYLKIFYFVSLLKYAIILLFKCKLQLLYFTVFVYHISLEKRFSIAL